VLAEIQGSFTFPPQQMPHASTYIQNSHLEFTGENPLLSGIRRGSSWDVYELDWNSRNFIALIRLIYDSKAQNNSANI
jgi:hypothetical protein